MAQDNIIDLSGRAEMTDPLTELLGSGARQLICQAVKAELEEFMAGYAGQKTSCGHAAVVRNGHQPGREIQTGIGPVKVRIPKVRSKGGQPVAFRSALVPPYVRKRQSVEAALSWLYLKGISSGEMVGFLKLLLGHEVKGLSANTICRLKKVWGQEYDCWRSENARLCALVIIGVNGRGEKHFLAIKDGVRESPQSRREVLLTLKSRGMTAPKPAIGAKITIGGHGVLGSHGRGLCRHPSSALRDA